MVTQIVGPNRSKSVDFTADISGWTSDDYVLRFWYYVQGYVTNKWGHHARNIADAQVSDMQGVAIETLINFARDEYKPLCERLGATPTDPRLFWSFVKRQLNWKLADYFADLRNDQTIEDDEEMPSLTWMRTQFSKHVDSSTLQNDLATALAQMNHTDQTLFALYYFEEMQRNDVCEVLGLSSNGINVRIRQAAERLLHAAMGLTTELQPLDGRQPVDWDLSRADQWTRATYGVPLPTYLEYVTIHYRADVSYLVDILNTANRIYGRRYHYEENPRAQARGARLTDEQVNEIRRRLANGERGRDIAPDYPVKEGAIYAIKRGDAYGYVPRDSTENAA